MQADSFPKTCITNTVFNTSSSSLSNGNSLVIQCGAFLGPELAMLTALGLFFHLVSACLQMYKFGMIILAITPNYDKGHLGLR